MDLISMIVASLINASVGCTALPAEVHRMGGHDYLVKRWACQDTRGLTHEWRSWQRACVFEHAIDWGRPYFLEDMTTHLALYVNRFGELQGGPGALITEAYVPLCGS